MDDAVENNEYVIFWWTPVHHKDYEVFSSLADACNALDEWQRDFPWNRYTLAQIKSIAYPTQEFPRPHITVIPAISHKDI